MFPSARSRSGSFTRSRQSTQPRFGDLISSTSYFHRYSQDVEDGTMWIASFQGYYYSPLPYIAATVLQTYDSREVTQELRFQSHLQAPVQFVAGFFLSTSSDELAVFLFQYPASMQRVGIRSGPTTSLISLRKLSRNRPRDSRISPIRRSRSWSCQPAFAKPGWKTPVVRRLMQPPSLNANSAYSFDQKQQPVTPRFAAKYSFDADDMTYCERLQGLSKRRGEYA